MYLSLGYFIFVGPAILLALLAQWWVRSAYSSMQQIPARVTGVDAARMILDANGLQAVPIDVVDGQMSDHYDPRGKVVHLSSDVYYGSSIASVGIAAHEVGHAIQDARSYAPLAIRNLAVPAAGFGAQLSGVIFMAAFGLLFAGLHTIAPYVFLLGVIGFSMTVVFQLINLPVEFNASSRAKTELVSLGIVTGQELPLVSRMLTAAALTYVAATLESVMTLVYYLMQFRAMTQSDRS